MNDPRELHAFVCLAPDCRYDWRMQVVEGRWQLDRCGRCGSLYFEWLSFDFPPQDVYLNSECYLAPTVRPTITKLPIDLERSSGRLQPRKRDLL